MDKNIFSELTRDEYLELTNKIFNKLLPRECKCVKCKREA